MSMAKYNNQFLAVAEEWITEHGLMQYGGAELRDYLKEMGIHSKSHYNYLRDHPEYKEMIDRSITNYRVRKSRKLFGTLMEAAEGGYRESEVTDIQYKPHPETGNPVIAGKKVHKEKRYFQPSVAAGIFLLTNMDPQSFINRQKADVSIKAPEMKDMSLDQARDFLKGLEDEY